MTVYITRISTKNYLTPDQKLHQEVRQKNKINDIYKTRPSNVFKQMFHENNLSQYTQFDLANNTGKLYIK